MEKGFSGIFLKRYPEAIIIPIFLSQIFFAAGLMRAA